MGQAHSCSVSALWHNLPHPRLPMSPRGLTKWQTEK